jgi:predicted dehydrogenase
MTNQNKSMSRRKFFGDAAAISAVGAIGLGYLASSCSRKIGNETPPGITPLLEKAPDGKPLKAGLIGCGGRGTGAALNFLKAGNGLSITALADTFEDRLASCREKLKEQAGAEVPDDKCFVGLDAWKQVLESDIDIVILATPPYFRPEHFKAAVEARKHVFMEKPVAVDPVGVRSVIASAKKAETIGLTVVTGTQRRHQHDYIETYTKVYNGAIGKIVSGNVYWNQSKLWHRDRKEEWTDMEFMIRDWVNWTWLSGDHIVEQHVHNIDVAAWFTGKFPVRAVGFGSRHRRVTGDQYDNFSVDFVYDDDTHIHSMCRQINDCTNNVSELLRGTEGYTNCKNTIFNPDGSVLWKYEYPLDDNGEQMKNVKISPYDQEHVDLVTAIRTDTPINEAEVTAKSTLAGIMGRISAYTGKEVTWEEMMASELKLGPAEMVMGKVDMTQFTVPVPGSAPA